MNITEDKDNITGGKIYEGNEQRGREEGLSQAGKMNEGRVRVRRRPSQVAILAMQSQSQG